MSIQVRDLSKNYGNQKAVDGLSFSVSQGEIAGFLGPNGAGKSTTMKMITGYLQPDSGAVSVCGFGVKEEPMKTRQSIGYLPEANPLYPDMYVREYLGFIADLHNLKQKKVKIESAIQSVGLMPESRKKIGQLSKGYKQRVGLAAALIHDPRVLILDEPTNGLDPNQIIEIREVIRRLGKDKTILFSSHILQEIQALCERVIIIHQGKLVADSRLADLQEQKNTSRVRIRFQENLYDKLLLALPAADSVRLLGDQLWEIEAKEPAELKKQLLELALQNNLNIVSLQNETRSLEDIFRDLTIRNETIA
jgi:ABC-2 type transport system ATP-binding protein